MTAIEYLDTTDTVRIATELKAGGEVVTLIWSVVVDGVPYIRNAYGDGSKWFRRLLRTHHAVFVNGSERYPVTVEKLDDEAINARVDAAYRTKYAGQGSPTESVATEPVRSRTYRVIPE
jgi:hypothetical protein